jgi:hypothetical protein
MPKRHGVHRASAKIIVLPALVHTVDVSRLLTESARRRALRPLTHLPEVHTRALAQIAWHLARGPLALVALARQDSPARNLTLLGDFHTVHIAPKLTL